MPALKHTSAAAEIANAAHPDFDEAEFQREILKANLPAALEMLPERQREVFMAHSIEGVSYERLAARFHDTEVNIRAQYSRARKALVGLLAVVDN